MAFEDYDVKQAFARIEEELISSMMRNLANHLKEESDEGFDWSQWQVEQLKYLEEYRKRNKEKFGPQFADINQKMQEAIQDAVDRGQKDEEIRILKDLAANKKIQRRYANQHKASIEAQGDAFFRVNDNKLEALLTATQNDMEKAEHAVLRRANDQYRKIIFDAQVYANTGAGTIEKAIDMAAKDFLSRGIDSIEYKNGTRHTIKDYADMYIRTAERRAYLMGEGKKRQEWGESLVIVNRRGTMKNGNYGTACPQCIPWLGKILIDDVYSGGKPDGKHQLLSEAMAAGFLHPRCKDSFTTYIPGISPQEDPVTKQEAKKAVEAEKEENRLQYAERQQERYERLAEYSLDPENQRKYEARAAEWTQKSEELTERRKQRLARRRISEASSEQRVEFDGRVSEKQRQILEQLSAQYRTRLQKVTIGAERAAGDVDISGARMRLSGKAPYTAIHEFAHTLANTSADKYGLTHDQDFWKEIKKIRREYMKDVEGDPSRWISSYEHSNKSLDEFMAEAFTHAKMREMGMPIPDKYGDDFIYSQRVLDTVEKYFGKDSVLANSGNNVDLSQIVWPIDGKLFKSDPYEVVGSFGQELKSIFEKNIGTLQSDEIIIMEERLRHIKDHHPEDYELFGLYGMKCVLNPDIIITDDTVPGTVFMIKRLDGTNVSAVTRLALTTDQDGFKNSIITFHRMREKSIRNKAKRGRIIYKKEV